MKNNLNSSEVEQLFEAILSLKDTAECRRFFKDICTVNELTTLSQRFDVGIRLLGGMTYQEVSRETGASTATISRVNRSLSYGAGGYHTVLSRMAQKAQD